MKTTHWALLAAGLTGASGVYAVDLLSLTDEWIPVLVTGDSDPVDDNQANSGDIELVGDPANDLHAFYVKFDDNGNASSTDGTLAFRIRVAEDKPPSGFKGYARIGVDVDLDGGLDFYIGAELDDAVTIMEAGTGLNTGPGNSTLGSTLLSDSAGASNYNWSSVSSIDGTGIDTDLDGGGKVDYFLSYSIDFSDLVALAAALPGNGGFNDGSGLGYVVFTSQNPNNFNSDIGGVDNSNFNPNQTWTQLGAINDPVDAYGNPTVPEPGTFALLLGLGAFASAGLRRR